MRVEHVMTRDPARCRPHDTTAAAARVMWDRDCGSVPVVDEAGMPVGMITDRDICMAAYTRGARLEEMTVDTVMSADVRTCRPRDAIAAAERLMARAQVRRLPVVDEHGRLVGIVALGDVARARGESRLRLTVERVFADVAKTLAAISQPRVTREGARA